MTELNTDVNNSKRLYRADGSPRPVGVVGHPVAHSLSPEFQNAAFQAYGLPHRYQKWDVAPADLPSFLNEMRGQDFLGLNLTVPHKQAVLDLLETGTPEVEATGAANTLFLHEADGQILLAGHNTDPTGFMEALIAHDFNPTRKRVLVLGAGGAGRAVAYALAKAGAIEIAVANRSFDRAAELVAHLSDIFPNSHIYATPFDPASWPFNRNPRMLVVNATSYGLAEDERDTMYPISPEHLSGRDPDRHTLFFELLYGFETPFLRTAQAAGAAHAIDGTEMLVNQGAASFELWTGLAAPRDTMLAAIKKV